MEHLLDPQWEGTSPEEPASPTPHIAGNRLILDVYLDGCERFLQVTDSRTGDLVEVEFLRLSSNDAMITSVVADLPRFSHLRSLVLKGGHLRDDYGRCQNGLLTTLPQDISKISLLRHLDLSFNNFLELPSCITALSLLTTLHLGYNHLKALPEEICELTFLTDLLLMSNQLEELPAGIGRLKNLVKMDLSENKLASLPEEIGNLQQCADLYLSENILASLPETVCNMMSLQQLYLHNNVLVAVPAGLASLPHLTRLDLQNNRLRTVPTEIMHCSCVYLQGNPIGEPEPSPLSEDESQSLDLKEIYVKPEDKRAVSCTIRIYYQILLPDQQHVRLGHHDVLLSSTLELQPHGIQFHQDVEINIPFAFLKPVPKREVVIRTFTDGSGTWTDLSTTMKERSLHEVGPLGRNANVLQEAICDDKP